MRRAEKIRAIIFCVILSGTVFTSVGMTDADRSEVSAAEERNTGFREIVIERGYEGHKDTSEYINFDLAHLSIVGKEETDNDGIGVSGESDQVTEPDGEHLGADGAGSEIPVEADGGLKGNDTEDSGDSENDRADNLSDNGHTERSDYEEESEWTAEEVGEAAIGETTAEPSLTYLGNYTITFYCPCEICCGEWATGCTASGVMATEWHTVASGQFDFGTELYIEGLGNFVVEDRGVEGNHIDIFVNDHQQALDLGLQYRDVYLIW